MGLFDFLKKNKIDINEAVANLRNEPSAVLIDVREPMEYAAGHIPGSMNIPVGSLQMAESAFPDKTVPVYVHCQTGRRSKTAAAILKEAGFTLVTDLGGINAYKGPLEY